MDIRNVIDNVLRKSGFDYFYAGIVSKKSIYQDNTCDLGERFINNLVEFKLNGKDIGTIISPEGTFRVYDYLQRKEMVKDSKGKVFYSQEFLRNESLDEIRNGKTMSFWQTGFEIYGYDELESSVEALGTVIKCFKSSGFDEAYYRVSDKRILKGLLLNLSLEQQRDIYYLIDKCGEDGDKFESSYIKHGGNNELARKIALFLNLGKNEELSLDDLDDFVDNSFSHNGIEFIKEVVKKINSEFPNAKIKFIPFMGKSWDACDSLLFDVRLPNYDYAVAGGGNLSAFNKEYKVNKSGAGIGVTRLAEYMIENDKEY